MYKESRRKILGLHNVKVADYWRDRAEVPLFSRGLYDDYEDNIVPDEDVVTLKVDTRNAQERTPFNCLVCASTGIGKDRLIKNIIKGYYKQGYRILIFEPKGYEMLNGSKVGKGRRLHHLDKNESVDIVGYCPNYIRFYIEKNFPEMLKKVKFYSPDVSNLDYVEIWQSFGVPVKISSMVVEMIQAGITDFKTILHKLESKDLHRMTSQAVSTAIDSIRASNFFGARNNLPLEELWNDGKIVNIMYMSRDGAMMNTDVGLILDLIRDIGIKESRKGLKHVTKKLLIFNDSFYYAGMSATMATRLTGGINLAVRNIQNCQNNFRTWGIDSVVIVQSPDPNAIHPALIDGCTTKLVSYIENPSALSGKMPFSAFSLLNGNKPGEPSLYIDEDKYIYQWIYIKGKTKWTAGFPFDCSIGHT